MAFDLANDQLHVEPLLDPDDVNCVRPGEERFSTIWSRFEIYFYFRQKVDSDVHHVSV